MPNGVKCQRAKSEAKTHVGMARDPARRLVYDKRLMYEYRIEPMKCDRDAMKQECRLAHIACSGTQPPTHISEKIQRARGYCPRVSSAIDTKRRLWGDRNTLPPSERRQVLQRQQHNDLSHGGKTEQAY